MRLTTKGRFAVTAVLDVALHGAQGPVTLAAISERQDISLSYLEQLFGKLRRCGLVESVRGPGGGYNLTKPPSQVSVADIIFAVDEPIDATRCGGRGNCRHEQEHCMTHDLWSGLTTHIFNFMHSVTLEQLVAQHRNKGKCTPPPEKTVIIQDLSSVREPTLI
ncbi:MAG: Fe-S cluster assembly transcription factor [Burkholderiales bacterium]|jgi:Rrf2 family iron-sulfur cluster assembly transcriptional regulator|nr:Fe-S cluster assembly transcription factor [Burkholderiales bacterium]